MASSLRRTLVRCGITQRPDYFCTLLLFSPTANLKQDFEPFLTHRMIIDTLANAGKYFSVHPLFQNAFEYIGKTDLNAIEMGKYEIHGDALKAVFSNKKGMSADDSVAKFECHNKHIDIQLCITGVEKFGWKPREKCAVPNGDYNEVKDTQLYTDVPDMYFELTNGQFAILFPEDVHAPMIGTGEIKKLVIKVKI